MVNKTVYDKLAAKVNAIDTSRYDTNKSDKEKNQWCRQENTWC